MKKWMQIAVLALTALLLNGCETIEGWLHY